MLYKIFKNSYRSFRMVNLISEKNVLTGAITSIELFEIFFKSAKKYAAKKLPMIFEKLLDAR